MADKEIPPPLGCWSLLLGLPVLVLMQAFSEKWEGLLRPLLTPHLGPEAVSNAITFSELFFVLAAWTAIMKFVDLVFGTKFEPYGARDVRPLAERARLRRQGLLVIAGVILLDQITKAAFGVTRAATSPDQASDAMLVFQGFGLALFTFAWWRSREPLEVLAVSLLVGALACMVSDYALRGGSAGLQFPFLPPLPSAAEIVSPIGLLLFVVSRFWEPRRKDSANAPEESPHA